MKTGAPRAPKRDPRARRLKHAASRILAVGLAQTMLSCLAFKDFDVVDEAAGTGSGAQAGDNTAPCAGPFECISRLLRSCQDGFRVDVENCATSGRWCNANLGACTDCRAGEFRCEGDVLESCNETGQFALSRDCAAQGMFCSEAKGDCVPCISGRRYCATRSPSDQYDQRFTCVDFQIPSSAVDCIYGCVPTQNGGGDCANCEVAGEVYCPPDGMALLRCPLDRTQTPTIEQECPYGCDPDATLATCLETPAP